MAAQDDREFLTDRQLITLAGEAAFGRGQQYYRQGMVTRCSQQGTTISADVEGSQPYRVQLRVSQRGLDGSCNCPASEGIDFCKHCVAVAMAYRAEQAEQWRLAEGDATDRVQAYLQQMSRDSLIESLQSLIESDPALYQQWSMRADAVLGGVDHKELKKRITAAFPINRNLFRYGQVRAYFAAAEPVVDQLIEQIPQLPTDKALKLADYALSRLDRALQSIDDSGGFRFHCEEALQTLHVKVVGKQDWSAEKRATYLFELAFGDTHEFYAAIPDAYTEALGAAGLEAYHACSQGVWDALPQLPANADWSQRFYYMRLRDPLIKRAEAAGDLPAILAMYEKTASDEKDCLDAAKACLAHGDWERLEQWLARVPATRSPWADERQRLAIRLRLHRGEPEAAAELQWQCYQATTRLEDYRYLLELAETHELTVDYRQGVHDWLTERLEQTSSPTFLDAPWPANCLLEIYLLESRLDEARVLCGEHKVASGLLYQLARALDPEQGLPLYARLVRHRVQQTNNQAYRQAIAWLQELHGRLQKPADYQAFNALLTEVRAEFKQKRNFIKWLNETFSD
ncbi:SWIM zinc finger family protein [Halomonas halmophila]|uniref:SWIM-type domain-containing protein n=1 Tax=Halomonas halmophila TaxID=252 RepID=A0A4Y4EUK2_9GAMM|nr:SWIM zinc finger family protein [Halomonas halmophila]GED21592.1 hypothetical protein HHA01_05690 [Halomonas halmophila]